jgi:hypothetical protein
MIFIHFPYFSRVAILESHSDYLPISKNPTFKNLSVVNDGNSIDLISYKMGIDDRSIGEENKSKALRFVIFPIS